jgi:hypothetical protein
MVSTGSLQVDYPFELPRGYVDAYGNVHQEGTMRLATAMDEIMPLRDPRVRANEAYLVVVLLAQTVTRLGSLPRVTPEIIEGLFASDLAYLQEMYQRLNSPEPLTASVVCPNCGHEFEVEIPPLGG